MKDKFSRRDFIKKTGILTVAAATLSHPIIAGIQEKGTGDFTLPDLPYAHNALEPYIDSQTMQIHHGKHHKGYVDNLNKAVKENNISTRSLEEILSAVSKYPASVRNNAGGHYNHSLFWKLMSPAGKKMPSGKLAEAINSTFGNFTSFQEKFNAAATGRFGSGWAWLVADKSKLVIGSTPNQDNPLMDVSELKGQPLLALDVWEHAYYLKYQNKRGDYVNAFWNLVNWDEAERHFSSVK